MNDSKKSCSLCKKSSPDVKFSCNKRVNGECVRLGSQCNSCRIIGNRIKTGAIKKVEVIVTDIGKECLDCKKVKNFEDFSPSKRGKLGRSSYCRSCSNTRSSSIDKKLKCKYTADYRRRNKEVYLASHRINQYKRRSKKDAANDGSITPEYLRYLYSQTDCCWCHTLIEPSLRTLEHIVELNSGGLHSIHNTNMSCKSCNSRRLNKLGNNPVPSLGAIYIKETMQQLKPELLKTEVRLVGYTQPSEEFKESFKDVKDLVAFCARVSNPSNQYNAETSDKLINYLAKHKHWSPFEMASCTMEVSTTRDIARQLLRHRSFAFQEFSQRYADPTKDLKFVYREARLQDTKNRQNSITVNDQVLQDTWNSFQQQVINASTLAYNWAISNGIAKEQARSVLPEGNTMSRLYVQGSIRSWIHYIDVRTDESTQLEHRVLAQKVAEAINSIFSLKKG